MKDPRITELQVISHNTDSRSSLTSGTTMEYINKEMWRGDGRHHHVEFKERERQAVRRELVESLQHGM